MRADDVHEVLDLLARADVPAVVDGGWGVDALLGRETRAHSDLDLVVERDRLDAARAALAAAGFRHAADAVPGLPARFVLRDDGGRQVDLHVVVRDADGNAWQELDDGALAFYPAAELGAIGSLGGRSVPCVSAELQLRHHLGYRWSDVDRTDLAALADRFDIPLPPPER